ncbi:MAG: glutamate-5-semialdehyde dehydrogenase [Actinomycetaceae bacterium]|nr:glutamate-5-semialdehyde dehydrogenase [Arcanobacterium sp.]MDD7504657.1 glutamate-5-semialdehyde dehydrogenase [Actinomycetaceae bacterium]MDY6143145.1 glutamate-5-semialdehyde dehydrogenase [Arcanobacterium sp.]
MENVTPTHVDAEVRQLAHRAKHAARRFRSASTIAKNEILTAIASQLRSAAPDVVRANTLDVEAGRQAGMAEGLVDRLTLTQERIESIASAVEHVRELPDPVGEIVSGRTLPNGLRLMQKRVPMGVIGMIYEARPNVTVDAAVLALKSGNAAVLRGGSAAIHTNEVLVSLIRDAVADAGFPHDLIASIDEYGRDGAVALMHARGLVDLVIPRGGAGLISTVVSEATVPVIETGVGNVHVYIDAGADLAKARNIVKNSKLNRVGVCNAAESLLIHRDVAEEFVPMIVAELDAGGVVIHGDSYIQGSAPSSISVKAATDDDWATEYLAPEIAVRVVNSIDEAIDHIALYSSGHTEAIVSEDYSAIEHFIESMDSAAVIVNASTRFTDGGEFGLGAEIGISTQKLHARGPMGLTELTTTTWIVMGDGQIRS